MLAEPRRRQKWALNPRGNLWSKDEDKLGNKMMEKMGWKTGDGLGATNQGIKDPISIKANSDNRGIGHEVGMDDVWLNQKDDFDDVLASLNSAHASTANSDNEQEGQESSKTGQTEKQSLRDISKKSKKRVHYEKFTKGKDLSRMSQKDLANILGTDKAKKRRIDEGLIKEKIEKERKEEEEKAKKVDLGNDKEAVKDNSGLLCIQGGSIDDYFKAKMEALKAKRKRFSAEGVTIDFKREKPTDIKEEVVGDGTDEKPFFRGFSSEGMTQPGVTIEKLQEREFTEIKKEQVEENPIEKTEIEKKKKKKRRSTNQEETASKSSEEEPQKSNIETVDETPVKKKKKKKSSKEKVEEVDTSVNTTTEIFENVIKGVTEEKKKKKSKSMTAENISKSSEEESQKTELEKIDENAAAKSEKKKKKKAAKEKLEEFKEVEKVTDEKKKKSKKQKIAQADELTESTKDNEKAEEKLVDCVVEEPETKKEKKSKKKKKHLIENENVAEVKMEKNLSVSKNGKKKKIKPDISSVKSFNGASLDKIKGYGY